MGIASLKRGLLIWDSVATVSACLTAQIVMLKRGLMNWNNSAIISPHLSAQSVTLKRGFLVLPLALIASLMCL